MKGMPLIRDDLSYLQALLSSPAQCEAAPESHVSNNSQHLRCHLLTSGAATQAKDG
jgi:hypothetical protein